MDGYEILRRLYQEQSDWKSYGNGLEVSYTLKGIKICIKQVKDMIHEQHLKHLSRKKRINKWCAGDLFHAIVVALKYLGSGDRAKAIAALEKAKEKAENSMQ